MKIKVDIRLIVLKLRFLHSFSHKGYVYLNVPVNDNESVMS
jgi:hypothetical protein